ncbi:hypothetical protein ACHWQZ_G006566 [Mnemiopsis leidyi]
MDAKPYLFLSSLPDLTDYVTLHGEVTTSGPHLLNCACCRALLRRSTNILCSPTLNDKKRVYIVVHKNDVKRKEFSESVAACNLRLLKVVQITNAVLQCCLDFTIHTYLNPLWTRIKNYYYQGKSCLFQNESMGCVYSQLNVQVNDVILALKATRVTLTVPKLSKFHVKEETFRRFADKSIRTIVSTEMGDNTCYVLPSFKPALVHSISYDIDKNCPLKDRSDMMAYWLDYHGMLIPSDTNIFVKLSFNFPGAPTMTYPYYCVRKDFPALKHRTDYNSINDFVSDVNKLLRAKIPNFHLNFPTDPLFYTAPNQSKDCLVKTPCDVVPHKPSELRGLDRPQLDATTNIFQKRSVSPKLQTSSESIQHPVSKIKPRFTPYNKLPHENQLSTNAINSAAPVVQNKVVPNFKTKTVTSLSDDLHKGNPNTENIAKPVFSNLHQQGIPTETNLTKENFSRVDLSIKKTKSATNLSQKNTVTLRKPQTPSSIPSSFEHDDFDDFEIPQSLKFPSPRPIKTPESTHKQSSGMSSHSQSSIPTKPETPKKLKAPPRIYDDELIESMFEQGTLSKVNNQSLAAFLKSRNVKGVSKLKKDQLVQETLKVLKAVEPPREW